MLEKCCNHGCELNIGCKNYTNNTMKGEYYRPKIFFDEIGKPCLICNHFVPHNIESIIRQSKMNFESVEIKKRKLTFEIVEEFGRDKKPKLMRKLKALIN